MMNENWCPIHVISSNCNGMIESSNAAVFEWAMVPSVLIFEDSSSESGEETGATADGARKEILTTKQHKTVCWNGNRR